MRLLLLLALLLPGTAFSAPISEGVPFENPGAAGPAPVVGRVSFDGAAVQDAALSALAAPRLGHTRFAARAFNAPRALFPEIGTALGDGLRVEGSRHVGGKQNDFRIDYADADLFQRLVLPARAIGASGGDIWDRIRRIQELVNRLMPRDGIKRRTYHELNAASLANEDVSLGSYIRAGTGVCRENAIMTALALREAGFEARFAYFGVYESNGDYDEDHGTALVDIDGVTYIVDSFRPYGRYYNGHRLADILTPPADGKYPLASPLADGNDRDPGGWRLTPQPFPIIRKL